MIWNLENTYLKLPPELYKKCNPTPVLSPQLVIFNSSLSKELELSSLVEDQDLPILAGNSFPSGTQPLAQAYAGHQFGHFNILGDGRALLLGEVVTSQKKRFDIQLKGSGPTPFSRSGDGRAALGPMLREYLISEAMHGLGIPTTRSLAVVKTGESVFREQELPGAILTRVASSHLRVGTFQFAALSKDPQSLKSLLIYTIERHFPHLTGEPNPALALLKAVSTQQADLVSKWMSVGFIHGVMNTDNMTISGETIDYGPCAFMNGANLETVFSSIDRQGRYSYGNQPGIAQWNLARLAESLLPLINEDLTQAQNLAVEVIQNFKIQYETFWQEKLLSKLGLNQIHLPHALKFVDLIFSVKADFTKSFRDLSLSELPINALTQHPDFNLWHKAWLQILQQNQISLEAQKGKLNHINPLYIPRNHWVESALQSAVIGNLEPFHRLLRALSNPFTYEKEFDDLESSAQLTDDGYKTFCGT